MAGPVQAAPRSKTLHRTCLSHLLTGPFAWANLVSRQKSQPDTPSSPSNPARQKTTKRHQHPKPRRRRNRPAAASSSRPTTPRAASASSTAPQRPPRSRASCTRAWDAWVEGWPRCRSPPVVTRLCLTLRAAGWRRRRRVLERRMGNLRRRRCKAEEAVRRKRRARSELFKTAEIYPTCLDSRAMDEAISIDLAHHLGRFTMTSGVLLECF